jgi:putative flippase GtrA
VRISVDGEIFVLVSLGGDAMTKDLTVFLSLMLGTPAVLITVALAIVPINASYRIIASVVALVLGLIVGFLLSAIVEEKRRDESAEAAARGVQADIEGKIGQKTADTVDIALLNMRKLDEYYNLNKQQARRSFSASIAAVCVGFVTIIVSVLYAHDPNAKFAGGLAGVLAQFIGASFFYLHNKSLNQLNLFYGKLISLQNTMLALQVCEKLTSNKEDSMQVIALELMHRDVTTTNGQVFRSSHERSTMRSVRKAATKAAAQSTPRVGDA